jgi:hypothetical protein
MSGCFDGKEIDDLCKDYKNQKHEILSLIKQSELNSKVVSIDMYIGSKGIKNKSLDSIISLMYQEYSVSTIVYYRELDILSFRYDADEYDQFFERKWIIKKEDMDKMSSTNYDIIYSNDCFNVVQVYSENIFYP